MNRIEAVKLMTIEDGERMNEKESLQLFRKHINPNYGKMLSMLGFAQNTPVKAEGMYITLQDNRKILDLTGQFGIMCVGHNHPRILEVRHKWAAEKNLELWKFFP
ncbi:MAG TPA: aminotransferase class III-fold pyridoxal phosphate-dependent enzyme, partial [Bacillota bacterium]|nr:aminotransferase class III-fold pyridoxal phosphate-dependent enzyme [Bacillota bacterium]